MLIRGNRPNSGGLGPGHSATREDMHLSLSLGMFASLTSDFSHLSRDASATFSLATHFSPRLLDGRVLSLIACLLLISCLAPPSHSNLASYHLNSPFASRLTPHNLPNHLFLFSSPRCHLLVMSCRLTTTCFLFLVSNMFTYSAICLCSPSSVPTFMYNVCCPLINMR
jgi:hypothetical protein